MAYWCSIPPLVAQVLLLITFAVLPAEYSHRNYLSVGLCVSLFILYVSRAATLVG